MCEQIKSFAKGHKEISRFHSDKTKATVLVLWTKIGPHTREEQFSIYNFKLKHLSNKNIKQKALLAHISSKILKISSVNKVKSTVVLKKSISCLCNCC